VGAIRCPGMTSENSRRITLEIGRSLADIDTQVQAVARRHHAPSDLNELAVAVHKLIGIIKRLHGDL
jgi:hypothetical protein